MKNNTPFWRVFFYGTALEFIVFSAISMWNGEIVLAFAMAGLSALAILAHKNLGN